MFLFFKMKEYIYPKCRLLNPTKSELGKISKPLNVNQWQNSSEVIKWFKNIKNQNLHTFTVFDLQEFYPFIGEKLLKDAFLFANSYKLIQTSVGRILK